MHGDPAARNRRRARSTGKEVVSHVPHRGHDGFQRECEISEAGVPHALVLRRKGDTNHVAEGTVGDLLPDLVQAVSGGLHVVQKIIWVLSHL